MSTPAVHWFEGMFLRPHHFMTAQRHWAHQVHQNTLFDQHYHWGLRSIEPNLEALSNFRFVVHKLSARLRDGTVISVPEDGVLPSLDLKQAFEQTNSITVSLGVPHYYPSRANVAADSATEGVRYQVDTQMLEDENTGVNPQPIKIRRLKLKLLLSTYDQSGYEVIPIARLVKSQKAEATPELDLSYIPPVLACDAWPPLGTSIVQAVYDRIGKKIELLASQVTNRNITFDSQGQGDPLIFAQLRELNEAYSLFGILAFAQGVHPLTAYLELARLIGQLAIFSGTRRAPELPRYDHDDLGTCFYRAKQQIDGLLNIFVEPEYKERPFIGAGLRMQVALEPSWLESIWDMYIGVQSPLDTEECIRLLTKPGQLDMKIGSSERVDAIFKMGLAGLRFDHSPRPPRALPAVPGLIYFQVRREAAQAEWVNVQKSLTLAIRLNENLIAGNIQGQRVLAIRTSVQSTTLQFTLYVVAAESVR